MKSRINWQVLGDRNMGFYHTSIINRRRRNKITSLKDNVGDTISKECEVANHFRNWYIKLFATRTEDSQ